MVLVSMLIHTFWRKFPVRLVQKSNSVLQRVAMYLPPIETIVVILAFFSVFVNSFHRVFRCCQKIAIALQICHNILMKKHKNLLLISLLIFVAEYIGLIGWYWLFDGRAGDATLTISRYVGLNWWSSLIFCAGNMAIIVMVVYYLLTRAKERGALWRMLMYVFVIAFMALSISPHVPDESMPAVIHKFFAGVMFVDIALISLLSIAKAQRKSTLIFAVFFTIYSVYFCISDVLRVPYFMDLILWFESAYLYAFFALLILTERDNML